MPANESLGFQMIFAFQFRNFTSFHQFYSLVRFMDIKKVFFEWFWVVTIDSHHEKVKLVQLNVSCIEIASKNLVSFGIDRYNDYR